MSSCTNGGLCGGRQSKVISVLHMPNFWLHVQHTVHSATECKMIKITKIDKRLLRKWEIETRIRRIQNEPLRWKMSPPSPLSHCVLSQNKGSSQLWYSIFIYRFRIIDFEEILASSSPLEKLQSCTFHHCLIWAGEKRYETGCWWSVLKVVLLFKIILLLFSGTRQRSSSKIHKNLKKSKFFAIFFMLQSSKLVQMYTVNMRWKSDIERVVKSRSWDLFCQVFGITNFQLLGRYDNNVRINLHPKVASTQDWQC